MPPLSNSSSAFSTTCRMVFYSPQHLKLYVWSYEPLPVKVSSPSWRANQAPRVNLELVPQPAHQLVGKLHGFLLLGICPLASRHGHCCMFDKSSTCSVSSLVALSPLAPHTAANYLSKICVIMLFPSLWDLNGSLKVPESSPNVPPSQCFMAQSLWYS